MAGSPDLLEIECKRATISGYRRFPVFGCPVKEGHQESMDAALTSMPSKSGFGITLLGERFQPHRQI
jgi:hypothetical protein